MLFHRKTTVCLKYFGQDCRFPRPCNFGTTRNVECLKLSEEKNYCFIGARFHISVLLVKVKVVVASLKCTFGRAKCRD